MSDMDNTSQRVEKELLETIPLLRDLPAELWRQADRSEFLVPSRELAAERDRLESSLDAYIMTYRADAGAPVAAEGIHICRVLAPKRLSEPELDMVLAAERKFSDIRVRLVAYERPLRYRSWMLSQEE